MRTKIRVLLIIDSTLNLVLGVVLLLFPLGVIDLLGLPSTDSYFYPMLLGAVILGIGLALLIELAGHEKNFRGLGLGGAIAINTVGSLVLMGWLLFSSLTLPLRGWILLWVIGILVLLIGIVEFITKSWIY